MVAVIFLLAVMTLIIASAYSHSNEETSIEWSNFFSAEESVVLNQSTLVVALLPVHEFWDVTKASYRTGIIAESLLLTRPELVIERKAGSSRTVTHSIDTSTIFTHGLASVKDLDLVSTDLIARLDHYRNRVAEYISERQRTISEVYSRADLGAQIATMSEKAKQLEDKLFLKTKQLANKLTNMEYYAEQRTSAVVSLHNSLSDSRRQQSSNHQKASARRTEHLLQSCADSESASVANERALLARDLQVELVLLQQTVNISLSVFAYRAELQRAMFLQAEDADLRVVAMRAEEQRRGTSEVVSRLVQELSERSAELLQQDPRVLASYFVAVLVAVVLLAVVLELSSLLRTLVRRVFRPEAQVAIVGHSGGAVTNASAVLDETGIVCDETLRASALRCIDRLRTSCGKATERRAMPSILIFGPPGCGKSLLAKALSNSAPQCRVINVRCSDLDALGCDAGHFIRNLLSNLRGSGQKSVLVLEDADALLVARSSPLKSRSAGGCHGSRSAFFALLEQMRLESMYISVILVTRLDVKEVDGAILDRMDALLRVGLPGRVERLEYVRRSFLSVFGGVLHTDDRTAFLAVTSGKSAAELSETFLSAIVADSLSGGKCPEMDCPDAADVGGGAASSDWSAGGSSLQRVTAEASPTRFEAALSLGALIAASDGCSFRDMDRMMTGARFEAMATESCLLTSRIWMRELQFTTSAGGETEKPKF